MVTRLLLIAAGGAIGAVARYGVGVWAVRLFPAAQWPWGTLAVNVAGGLLMGVLAGAMPAVAAMRLKITDALRRT